MGKEANTVIVTMEDESQRRGVMKSIKEGKLTKWNDIADLLDQCNFSSEEVAANTRDKMQILFDAGQLAPEILASEAAVRMKITDIETGLHLYREEK